MVRTKPPDTCNHFFSQYVNSMRHSQSDKRTVRLVHVDTTQLDLEREFKLSIVQPPDDSDSGETIYEVKPSGQPSQDMQVKSNFSFTWTKTLYQKNFKYITVLFVFSKSLRYK